MPLFENLPPNDLLRLAAVARRRHFPRQATIFRQGQKADDFYVLLGGSVIMEIVFARQGVGNVIIKAIFAHDFYLVQGGIIVTATLFILVNLIVDFTYALLDPRITYA